MTPNLRSLGYILLISMLLVTLSSLETPVSYASTFIVPIDFPDLQTAINNAPYGSIIRLNIIQNVNNQIMIFGRRNLVIEGGGVENNQTFSLDSLIKIVNSENIIFRNFKVIHVGFQSGWYFLYSGIQSVNSTVSLENVSITYRPIFKGRGGFLYALAILGGNLTANSLYIDGYRGVFILDYMIAGKLSAPSLVDIYLGDLDIKADYEGIGAILQYTNDTVTIDGGIISIKDMGGIGINIKSSALLDPADRPLPGSIDFNIYNLLIRSVGKGAAYTGILSSNVRAFRLNIDNVQVTGFLYSLYIRAGGRYGRFSYGLDLKYNVNRLFSNAYSEGVRVENVITNDISIWLMNSVITDKYDKETYGVNILFDKPLIRFEGYILRLFKLRIENLTSDEVEIAGINLQVGNTQDWDVKIYNYTYNGRHSWGILGTFVALFSDMYSSVPYKNTDLSTLENMEDFIIAYSVIWNFLFKYIPKGGFGKYEPVKIISLLIYETVYDEFNSDYGGPITINSVWTLETLVLSSITNLPVYGVLTTYYRQPIVISQGYTGANGIYGYTLQYLYNPSKPYIAKLGDGISIQAYSDYTDYIPYIMDTYTMPYWYGKIIFRVPVLVIKAIGFSHKIGTTYLYIGGKFGFMAGFFSYTPDELGRLVDKLFSINKNTGSVVKPGFVNLELEINEMIKAGGYYYLLKGRIYFQGEWQPITFALNLKNGLIFASGPVDFRGMLQR